MPIYEFKCNECGHIFDELRKIGDYSNAVCSKCNSNKTSKVFSIFATGGKSCGSCSTSHGS